MFYISSFQTLISMLSVLKNIIHTCLKPCLQLFNSELILYFKARFQELFFIGYIFKTQLNSQTV